MALSVLLTHEAFPPDFRGGGEFVVLRTAIGLQASGVRVRVLTTGDPGLRSFEGVVTERLPMRRHAMNLQARRIAAAAREADLIHTFNYHACLPSLLAGRLVGRPVVCSILALFGSTWRDMKGPVLGRAFEMWERFTVSRGYDRTIFLSEPSRAAGLAAGAAPGRSEVNPPGIDHDRLRSAEHRGRFVLCAGRLDARKGIRHVMAAARALPDVPFRAVGWADDLDALRAMAPDNLQIIADHGGPAYLDLLSEAAIFFFPSYAETFGMVLAEAMACGCAVVSSVDTIPFSGRCVAPGDQPAMLAALRDLWENAEAAEALGRENRARAAVYSWEAHIDRLLVTYREVLGTDSQLPQLAA